MFEDRVSLNSSRNSTLDLNMLKDVGVTINDPILTETEFTV